MIFQLMLACVEHVFAYLALLYQVPRAMRHAGSCQSGHGCLRPFSFHWEVVFMRFCEIGTTRLCAVACRQRFHLVPSRSARMCEGAASPPMPSACSCDLVCGAWKVSMALPWPRSARLQVACLGLSSSPMQRVCSRHCVVLDIASAHCWSRAVSDFVGRRLEHLMHAPFLLTLFCAQIGLVCCSVSLLGDRGGARFPQGCGRCVRARILQSASRWGPRVDVGRPAHRHP